MNEASAPAGPLRRTGTLLRTVRPLRFAQVLAQLRHALLGIAPPRRAPLAGGKAPALAIARPATAYLPPPPHVKRLDDGRFELLATAFAPPSGADWTTREHGPLFAYHLHQHEYLRCADVPPALREQTIGDWIRSQRGGVGWDPHPTGLRLVAWGKLLTTPGQLPGDDGTNGGAGVGMDAASGTVDAARDAMLRSFADQAETLSHALEVRLQANHLLSNLLCVVFAGMLIDSPSSGAWRARAARLRRELAAQVHPDGGHEERSPMYHAALLEGVLDLLNLCRAAPERAPAGLADALVSSASRMSAALEVLSHPDGRIALFADSAFDVAPDPGELREYAARLGVGSGGEVARAHDGADGRGERRSARLPDTGYLRLVAGDWWLVASVAGPSPAHQPGHAHCDALAFELSVAGRPLVADPGVFEYVAGPRRRYARATSSHATLQVDGEEQAEIWSAHRVGGRPEVALVRFDARGEAEATCRGWSRRRTLHRRRFRMTPDGVEIKDAIEGPASALRACLPIAPGWEVELVPGEGPVAAAGGAGSESAVASPARGGAVARCRALDGSGVAVEITLPGAFAWRVEAGTCFPSFGRALARPVLVGAGATCAGASIRFRRLA